MISSVPEALTKKLEFGNPEQIEALKTFEREVAAQEEHTRKIKEGILKEYAVDIEFSGSTIQRIWATSKKEAEEIAREDGGEPDDLEIESVYAREMRR